jgi:hypothetical protein
MKLLFLAAAAAASALVSAPAGAQTPSATAAAEAEEKVNQLIVYGEDPCPPSTDDQITVCARRPEGDRFRIPKALRDDPNDRGGESWAERASALEYVGRSGIGSCSATGPGGMIGCFNQLVRQARAERNSGDDINWTRMIEQARKERRDRIDAAQAEETAASRPR